MDLIILKNFVLKLGFISERIKCSQGNNIDINVSNMNDGVKKINGTVTMKIGVNEVEVITFETYLTKCDSLMKFKSKYRMISFGGNNKLKDLGDGVYMPASYSNEIKTEDVFAIFKQDRKGILGAKRKLLVHKQNDNIMEVYSVSKDYQFVNGISDNFTLLNMKNQQVAEEVNYICGVRSAGKR